MSTAVGVQVLDQYCEKCGLLEQVDKLPLMGSPIPMISIYLAYIVFVLKLGPDYMRHRKPYGLKNVLLVYNFVKVILSAILIIRGFNYLWRMGLGYSSCNIQDVRYRDEIINLIWFYTMVKISDLLDTVFFVLRKKDNQVTFLHLYHHSLMMVGSWLFLKYVPSEDVIFIGCSNALIHFFNNGYYGLAALGPHMIPFLTWKKYLISMQLVEFFTQIVHYLITLKYSECPPSNQIALFVLMNLVVFITVFGNLYRKTYLQQKAEK